MVMGIQVWRRGNGTWETGFFGGEFFAAVLVILCGGKSKLGALLRL